MIQAAAAPAATARRRRPWWEGRPFVAAMILLAFVPLLYPPIPPVVDIGRAHGPLQVAADVADSPILQQWFTFHWLPIGNLGVDLLVVPLAKLIGLELATKLIVMAIPPMTVAGMLWVAREVHDRLPPTVVFALPFAFGHPFMFGFVNFALSMALALARLRAVAAARAAGQVEAARDPVRADQLHRLLRPHLRLGHARAAVLFGRGGAPARPRPQLVDGDFARPITPRRWRCRCC